MPQWQPQQAVWAAECTNSPFPLNKIICPEAFKGGADIEVLSHGISDAKSEVLWRFY